MPNYLRFSCQDNPTNTQQHAVLEQRKQGGWRVIDAGQDPLDANSMIITLNGISDRFNAIAQLAAIRDKVRRAIAGGADFTIPPVVLRQFTAHLPDCEWASIPEAGHCSYWERPDLWNAYVLDFLGRH